MSEFVTVYSKTTGEKQRVPEHWLGHKVLGADLRKTPVQKSTDEAKATATAPTKTRASGDEGKN